MRQWCDSKFCRRQLSRFRIRVLPPLRRSLSLLHAEGGEFVMRMASEEIAGLLNAAKEGDERAQAVLHELGVPLWTMVAMIVAWPFLATAMVLSHMRSLPPHSLHCSPIRAHSLVTSVAYSVLQRGSNRKPAPASDLLSAGLHLERLIWRGWRPDFCRCGRATALSSLVSPPLLPRRVLMLSCQVRVRLSPPLQLWPPDSDSSCKPPSWFSVLGMR